MKKRVKLQRNNSKKTYINIPADWLINLGFDISLESKDEIELVFNEKEIIIRKVEK